MMPKFYLTLLFFVIVFNVVAQKKALESITENDLKAHLEFIASDHMQGREFSTLIPGLEITADYLKAQLKKMGLNSVNESYFQEVEMFNVKSDTSNVSIEIRRKDGGELFKSDGLIDGLNTSENETLEGDIVFAGYGYVDKETGYNDLEGLDLKDRIVLIMTRNQKAVFDSLAPEWINDLELAKYDTIFKLGAKAIITCIDPLSQNKTTYKRVKKVVGNGILLLDVEKIKLFPGTTLVSSNLLIDNLLKDYNTTLEHLQNKLNQFGKPVSFPLEGIKAQIHLPKKVETVRGKNVIGLLLGSDPILKSECVIYTSHYDHLGVDENGEVYKGADDNGSGTVALLEIAEAFTKLKKSPKRSIVFIWTTAEEKGLWGSEHYSLNPVFPLENTLADINLDMIGRSAETEPPAEAKTERQLSGPNGLYVITGKQSTELLNLSNKLSNERGLVLNDNLSSEFLKRSDYFHFHKNGIPVLGLTTGMHEDYHKTTDDLEKIDYHKMKRVADYAFLLGFKLASQKKRIVVDNPSMSEAPPNLPEGEEF